MDHHKATAEIETKVMPVPKKVIIPLLQHIGVICEPKVKTGDLVKVGQLLADSAKMMSAPIHSSVSGKVLDINYSQWAGGTLVNSIEIETDGLQTLADLQPPVIKDKKDFIEAVRASGLVGLGGAGFPTHVKVNSPEDKKIDTLLINAAECEPYICSDYRVMMEDSTSIIKGIKTLMENLGVHKVAIGIEKNKPKAIELLKKLCQQLEGVEVVPLASRYPQGAEKMLIFALTGRKVPQGKLPSDVGALVMNVTSVACLAKFIETGLPITKKKITVAGPCVKNPMNLEVLIGTTLKDVFDFAGGFSKEPKKILMGGPMMGVAQHTLDTCVIKQTNALLAFSEEAVLPAPTACIRCGKCSQVCPMGLLPFEINKRVSKNDSKALGEYQVMNCIECGSCAYTCPSKIQLVQAMRLGKTQLKTYTAQLALKQKGEKKE